jgi:hypothetical protein
LTVEADGEGVVNPAVGVHDYVRKTPVEIAASPASGWKFDHWEGDITGPDAHMSFVIYGDMTVKAVFVKQ